MVGTDVVHYPERAFSELTVAAHDRPGLFATITGVLTANSMNILWASIATGADGRVLDVFRVSHGENPELAQDPDRWARIGVTLEKALAGAVEDEALVAQTGKRPSYMARKYVPRVNTSIEIDNDVSDHFTVIDVYTGDRPGLLFTITNTLFHEGLSVHLAKITTNVDQVLDVFYVTDEDGRKLEDDRQQQVRRTLEAHLGEPAEI